MAKNSELAERVQARAEARASGSPKSMDEWIEQYTGDFLAAMPKQQQDEMRDQFVRLALNELRWQPALRDCDPFSLIGALMSTAELGLRPSGMLDHVYFSPRNVNVGTKEKPQWVKRVQLTVGYKGYKEIANRAGILIDADVVQEGDHFRFWRANGEQHLEHAPAGDGLGEPGEVRGAFATALFVASGRALHRVVNLTEIARAKKSSDAGRQNKGPWVTDFEAMCKKTAVRRLWDQLPHTPEGGLAVAADGRVFRDVPTERLVDNPRPVLDVVSDPESSEEEAKPETEPEQTEEEEDPERPFDDGDGAE